MSVTVHLPLYIRPYTGNAKTVEVDGDTTEACLGNLVARFPEAERMLYAAPGLLHDYVSVFINGEFTYGEGLKRKVEDGTDIRVIYVLSGG